MAGADALVKDGGDRYETGRTTFILLKEGNLMRMMLNADVGEGALMPDGTPVEPHIFPLIRLANIACGGHAGSTEQMLAALRLARQYQVGAGAHPGYEDRERFGREAVTLSEDQLADMLKRQISCIYRLALQEAVRLTHVKPHGALYHLMASDAAAAGVLVKLIRELDSGLAVVTLPESALAAAAEQAGLQVWTEGFADRRYETDGRLTPRSIGEAAYLDDAELAHAQASALMTGGILKSRTGETFRLNKPVYTICVHGDGAAAIPLLKKLSGQPV